jgi:hypothetical protein
VRAPNGNELEAIKRVAARPEGALIHDYLQANMKDTVNALIQNNDAQQSRVLQGEARVLDVLLKVWKP